jgi:hypothetical protein
MGHGLLLTRSQLILLLFLPIGSIGLQPLTTPLPPPPPRGAPREKREWLCGYRSYLYSGECSSVWRVCGLLFHERDIRINYVFYFWLSPIVSPAGDKFFSSALGYMVLLHGSCKTCTLKRCITFRCITKQTVLLKEVLRRENQGLKVYPVDGS